MWRQCLRCGVGGNAKALRGGRVGFRGIQHTAGFDSKASGVNQTIRIAGAAVAACGALAWLSHVLVVRAHEQPANLAQVRRNSKSRMDPTMMNNRSAAAAVEWLEPTESRSLSADWKNTLKRIVPAIVSLKLDAPKAFDTVNPFNGSATGFVVDNERGIILTNRHVVSPGPIEAEGVFQNHEEVRLIPIYRDPVHDFGFFRYDPSHLKHLTVPSLPLCPEKASVGTEIRVVGNDAAEKLAIASGTLARLDRDAPDYGRDSYNDFNTFYFQASSGTTGGSSGSPVLNHDGEVLALNAGGKVGTSAGFYLPLDRVKRALELIQNEQDVTRGTIQTVFRYKSFGEVRRLGLSAETEELIRAQFPSEAGMLTVAETVPHGPAFGKLEPGDVILKVNGEFLTHFVPLESVLDDHVGKSVSFVVERLGERLTFEVPVQDLHAVTPSRYLEFSGGIINPLSYQQARNYALSPGAPYIANAGYALQHVGVDTIIHSVNGVPTPDLSTLRDILIKSQEGDTIVVKFSQLGSHGEFVEVVRVDRRWFPLCECTRNDRNGVWECQNFDEHVCIEPGVKKCVEPVGSTAVLPGKNEIEAKLSHSLVTVSFNRPFDANGLSTSSYKGTGLVLDASAGLVVVDRNTVTDSIGDATVTIANTMVLPARVVFVHPVHNFAFVQYDPELVGNTPIEGCDISKSALKPSDPVWLVGLSSSRNVGGTSELVSRETIVSNIMGIALPNPSPPRFQEHNLEMISMQDVVRTYGGAVCSPEGKVQAFWASFWYQDPRGDTVVERDFESGIPIELIMESAEPLLRGEQPEIYDLGVDFEYISLAKGRQLGLDQSLADQLEAQSAERRTILSVMRPWGGTDAAQKLRDGDIIISIDGELVTTFREVERRCKGRSQVRVEVIRDGKKREETVKIQPMSSSEASHIVFWQGILLQSCPLAVSTQWGLSAEDGVYVSCRYTGSPAARSGPTPTSFIKEIDGVQIRNLEDLLLVVNQAAENDAVRIKYSDLNGQVYVTTMKMEPKHWPTSELVYENGQWRRKYL